MRRLWGLVFAIGYLAACANSSAFDSDPEAFSPPSLPRTPADSAVPVDVPDGAAEPDCSADPAWSATTKQSASDGVSHRKGEACLEGCHQPSGKARTVFAAGGTTYRAETSREVAGAGNVVYNVGGTALTVDRCGNFYAIPEALRTKVRATQPYVQGPTFRKMEKPINLRDTDVGDCNQSGCHDFSTRTNWGIYF
jgi:hypothetical protein